MREIKERDVYRFQYNDEHRPSQHTHCFDGQLVAIKIEGDLMLCDSYSLDRFTSPAGGRGHQFTPEEAAIQGRLSFMCNLEEVEQIRKEDTRYYAHEDIFDLSYQHHCFPFFVIRKGAERNADKMLKVLSQQQREVKTSVESAMSQLQQIAATKQRIEDGFIDDVWLPWVNK